MASACPKCQSAIADDFGLINCPKCGASLFIEMDGKVRAYELGDVDDQPPEAINTTMKLGQEEEAPSDDPDGGIELQWDDDPVDMKSPPTFGAADIGSSTDDDSGDMEDEDLSGSGVDWGASREAGTSGAVPTAKLSSDNEETDMLTNQEQIPTVNFFQPKEGEEPPTLQMPTEVLPQEGFEEVAAPAQTEYAPPPSENLEDMSNIAKYGNSEESQGRVGPLRVKVRVSGIDSPEVREELRAALTDKRFLWDTEEMMRSIAGGVLVIPSATPLKAAIFIERIKAMPLEVSWEQFAINQP